MIKLLIFLERKKQVRGSKTTVDIIVNVFKWLTIVYFGGMFFFLGLRLPSLLEDFFPGQETIAVVSQYLVYYFVFELMLRFFFQKLPVANLKPLLIQAFPRSVIIRFFLGRSYLSVFNIIQLLFFIPFAITSIKEGTDPFATIVWVIAMYSLISSMHFVVILMESYNWVFYSIVALVVAVAGAQYYEWFDATLYTKPLFYTAYQYPITIVGYLLLPMLLALGTFRYYKVNMYLDNLIADKIVEGKTQEMAWLDRFGKQALFLKNDIRLMIRNKRAKSVIWMSLAFLFYGFLLIRLDGDEISLSSYMLTSFMVTGGFMMTFGQYVPSWDSSYYPLLMTQNINYIEYLQSKWLVIVLATFVLSLLGGIIYIYFSIYMFYILLGMGVFHMGITSFIVLIGGAYLKSPVDLTANQNVFGEKKAFNARMLLLALPQMLLPVLIFAVGYWKYGMVGGSLILFLVGVIGILCRNVFFNYILKVYKKEKHSTLEAFKKG